MFRRITRVLIKKAQPENFACCLTTCSHFSSIVEGHYTLTLCRALAAPEQAFVVLLFHVQDHCGALQDADRADVLTRFRIGTSEPAYLPSIYLNSLM